MPQQLKKIEQYKSLKEKANRTCKQCGFHEFAQNLDKEKKTKFRPQNMANHGEGKSGDAKIIQQFCPLDQEAKTIYLYTVYTQELAAGY